MNNYLFIYVVARDFGFAPNPFHGVCTLATCVPKIRGSANIRDWVMGVGGSRLKSTGKIIYLMRVDEIVSFDEYWLDERFANKKPIRNGSLLMMVGDNIYHKNCKGEWIQEDSHHSNVDGSQNDENIGRDTSSDRVLISRHFYYFGKKAKKCNFKKINYKNHRGHSKKSLGESNIQGFINQIEKNEIKSINTIQADPFDFNIASKRVDQKSGRIS